MARGEIKEAAEAVLRELPSVVGAFVKEDVYGQPREIHLLVRPGPDPRYLAHDVRELLEERLGIPVDQRVISIAQLAAADPAAVPPARTARPAESAAAPGPGSGAAATGHTGAPERPGGDLGSGAADVPAAVPGSTSTAGADVDPRVRFVGVETQARDARVLVRAKLRSGSRELLGESTELEGLIGRARGGAAAALQAVNGAAELQGRFELENVSVVRVQDRDYVLVSAYASSPYLGRRPLSLAGAHPVELDAESAGALAALKAVNRVVALMLRLAAPDNR